ncbi:hypothetical protein [Nocardia brasiliensis]|uniref:hypothetical protein n=1 Tax=Nocardia brasiliensis TaxID=37326 RepID=UPI0036732D4C
MSNQHDDERTQEFTLNKVAALSRHTHGVIAEILAALPIPITVNPLPAADLNDALGELASARTALHDMPLDAGTCDAIAATLLG